MIFIRIVESSLEVSLSSSLLFSLFDLFLIHFIPSLCFSDIKTSSPIIMSDALEELWSKLSLTEDEQSDIIVEQGWANDPTKVEKNCALGKMLMRKTVNVEAMKNIFIKIWKLTRVYLSDKLGISCTYFILTIHWRKTEHFRSNLGLSINPS